MPKKRNLRVVGPSAPAPVAPVKRKNHFAIVLDRSGSMQGLKPAAQKAVNAIIRAIREGAVTFNQETTVSLYTFANGVSRDYSRVPATMVGDLVSYYPGGGTALFDAVGTAITDFEKGFDANDPNTSFVLLVVTDGEENASTDFFAPGSYSPYRSYRSQDITQVIKCVQATDRYTITFQLPPGYGRRFASSNGIPEGNVREWEQTEAGVREVEHTTTLGVANFYEARERGVKSVDRFYVQTNLDNLKKSDLKKLTDVQTRFKSWTVDKEADVKSFVESHGKKFVIGSVYYALTKKEKVQPQKAVLIQEKGTKAVYAGTEARTLIGLPQGVNAIVEPGNHANYDIYVQSTSVNRKLVRGTKVLFDTSLSIDLTPTWDHVGAQAAADAKRKVTF